MSLYEDLTAGARTFLDAVDARIITLEAANAAAARDLAASVAEARAATTALGDARAEIEDLHESLADSQQARADLEATIATLRARVAELEAQVPVVDTFVLGETEPSPETNGAGKMPGRPKLSDLRVIDGDVTVAAGTVFEDAIVNGRVLVDWGPDTVVRNVEVRGPVDPPTSGSARPLVEIRNLPAVVTSETPQVLVEFVTVRPQTVSPYWDAIGRKGFKTRRCLFEDVNDGWQLFSSTADGIVRVSDEGSCLTTLVQFQPDVAYSRSSPRKETHNDGIQNQGSLDAPDFTGTSINARHSETRSQPCPPVRTQVSAVMLNSNTQSRAGIKLDRVWIRGGIYAINAGLSNGYVEITNSRFERPGSAADGRAPDRAISIKSSVTRNVTGNRYLDNGATVPVING